MLLFKSNPVFLRAHQGIINAGVLPVIFFLAIYDGAFSNTVTILKCACFAVFLTANLTHSDNFIFRMLNHPAAKLIGVISYSMYIWQQPLTQGISTLNQSRLLSRFHDPLPVDIAITAVSLPMLGLISYLSYFYFERTFLKLREKFR